MYMVSKSDRFISPAQTGSINYAGAPAALNYSYAIQEELNQGQPVLGSCPVVLCHASYPAGLSVVNYEKDIPLFIPTGAIQSTDLPIATTFLAFNVTLRGKHSFITS